ncbi:chemotaxis protein CheR [Kineosporia sp. NBRC 101677]|uniref:CheR family methyltransferase n=1 Tax=Kineosporia sp. NBRC 101677 TaxID=3032197 RepID=UPI0024A5CBC4|nr:CheR family methyltransferase [Kineosporia sp. NBRC 101677]GLY16000.1 chemotaxis protein CheR [Kineosporia sp. NBRC 101677]
MSTDDGCPVGADPESTRAARNVDPEFELLLQHLKEARRFDFTGYKRTSLMRRVDHQMQSAQISTYADYQDYLELNPDEFTNLFNTILINVTSFFRDAEAWTQLRNEILPQLIEHKGGAPIRIWSAGCATGEEAYSLAISLAEELGVQRVRDQVKIYATDVDEEALAEARTATFSERQLRNVPRELVEKYFENSGQRYTFSKDLRRSVIFGRNDLLQDAPISHIDLLLCRNTLMYFNAETQSSIVRRLHFALEDTGVLFLGKAEMLLTHSSLFAPIDLKRRFFRKVVANNPRTERGLLIGSTAGYGQPATGDYQGKIRQEALTSSPVAQILLDLEGRLLLSNQRANTMFGLTSREIGRALQDLELSYRPVELRSHIDQAVSDRRPVWVRDVEWTRGATSLWLDIQIAPLLDRDGQLLGTSIYFTDVSRYRQLQGELEYAHRQLETAYEELQSTNEELETTNEELQSTVEELETTNEELQSTNEELETMNEELQSMNDELQFSNTELRERTDEVSRLNGFMEMVLTALQAGITVVNRDLQVQVWNSRAEELWGVRQEEAVGQHLLNLDIGLPMERLRPLIRQVLAGDGSGEGGGEQASVTVDAVNRRGRGVRVTVTVSPLHQHNDQTAGALIVMSLPE